MRRVCGHWCVWISSFLHPAWFHRFAPALSRVAACNCHVMVMVMVMVMACCGLGSACVCVRIASSEGKGVELLPTGEKYDGAWHNNLRHGRGLLRFSTGKLRRGIWRNGVHAVWEGEEFLPDGMDLDATEGDERK